MASSCASSRPPTLDLCTEPSFITLSPSETSSDSVPAPVNPLLLSLLPIPLQQHQVICPNSENHANGNDHVNCRDRGAIDVNQMPQTSDSEGDDADESQRPVLQLFGKSAPLKRPRPDVALYRERLSEASPTPRASDDEDGGGLRKKLRLSKEQSSLLEESFKQNSTLNSKQKHDLAMQLNLRPRQVEVWFQNRRARTKLKQTEVDCELLKRCCKTLTEENRRLQKEIEDLRAMKMVTPRVYATDFCMPLPAAIMSRCPSCERVTSTSPAAPTSISDCGNASVASLLSSVAKQHHFVPQQSSAAC